MNKAAIKVFVPKVFFHFLNLGQNSPSGMTESERMNTINVTDTLCPAGSSSKVPLRGLETKEDVDLLHRNGLSHEHCCDSVSSKVT